MANDSLVTELQVTNLTTAMSGVVNARDAESLGLGNVDNTADAVKPVSGPQAQAIAAAAPRIIYGNGRPDIPATLTTPGTPTAVAAALNGTQFVSLDGPQGAWEWRKRGSLWQCTDGDTGEIKINLPVTANVTAGYVLISRTNRTILCRLHDVTLVAGSGYAPLWADIPTGFRLAHEERTVQGIGLKTSVTRGQMVAVYGRSMGWLFSVSAPSNIAERPTDPLWGPLSWTTVEAGWPVALPTSAP